MNRTEVSLLLFLETCLVDRRGHVDSRRMNAGDFAIARRWTAAGFLRLARVRVEECTPVWTHSVVFSPDAWRVAAEQRRARAERYVQTFNREDLIQQALESGLEAAP